MATSLAEYTRQVMLQRITAAWRDENPDEIPVISFPTVASSKKEPSLRFEQIVKERCQTVAKLLWKQNPTYTTTELSEHPDIYNRDITGGGRYQPRTIYDWVAEVDPREQKDKIGRPAKRRRNNRNNLPS